MGKVGLNNAKYQGKASQSKSIDGFGIKVSTQCRWYAADNDQTGGGQSNGLVEILEVVLGDANAQGGAKETSPNGKVSISSLQLDRFRCELGEHNIQHHVGMQYKVNHIIRTTVNGPLNVKIPAATPHQTKLTKHKEYPIEQGPKIGNAMNC